LRRRAIRRNGTPLRADNYFVPKRTPCFVDTDLNIFVEQPSSARAVGCNQLCTVNLRGAGRIYPEREAGLLMRGTSARTKRIGINYYNFVARQDMSCSSGVSPTFVRLSYLYSPFYGSTLSQQSYLCLSYRIVPYTFHRIVEGLEVRPHDIGLLFYILGGGIAMLDVRMLRI